MVVWTVTFSRIYSNAFRSAMMREKLSGRIEQFEEARGFLTTTFVVKGNEQNINVIRNWFNAIFSQ